MSIHGRGLEMSISVSRSAEVVAVSDDGRSFIAQDLNSRGFCVFDLEGGAGTKVGARIQWFDGRREITISENPAAVPMERQAHLRAEVKTEEDAKRWL
jgi:hypothetical protein